MKIFLLGRVRVLVSGQVQRLAPFQAALLTLVYASGGISRSEIARALWGTQIDSRFRHRIRQLISATRKRVSYPVFQLDGQMVAPTKLVESDVAPLVQQDRQGTNLELAARVLTQGPLAQDLEALSGPFYDWCSETSLRWRTQLSESARVAWLRSSAESTWQTARDAAEAMVVLDPTDPVWVARLIEARGRGGQERAAEAAFADYCGRIGLRQAPSPEVVDVMNAVRSLPGVGANRATLPQPAFVGRCRETSTIKTMFDSVRRGTPGLAVVVGEAGIGKTRLLNQLRRTAHMDGLTCLHARAAEFERVIALSPLIDALLDGDLETHLDQLGEPWRTVVGQVLPTGVLRLPVGEPPATREENLPRRLFDAFSLLFQEMAQDRPTILFLDDLHWADSTTVATLKFFLRRSTDARFGIVATIRPEAVGLGDPCAAFLTDESKFVSHRVDLGDLSDREARSLIDDVMGRVSSQEESDALLHVAGRHPLYLVEVTRNHKRAADQGGSCTPQTSDVLPLSLREILTARIQDLSSDARNAAAFMAIGSGKLRLSEISDLTGKSIDRVVEVAEELQQARIADGRKDRVWIAHDLFRNAILADLSSPRTALLHRRMALLVRSWDEPPPGELATHLDNAGEREAAAQYGWIAGDRCFERGAVAEAAHFYELVARNETNPTRIARATARQGISLHLDRDMTRAGPILELAASRLRRVGLPVLARRMDIRRVESLAERGRSHATDILAHLAAIQGEAQDAGDLEALALALDVELQALLLREELEKAQTTTNRLQALVGRGDVDTESVVHSALAVGLALTSTTEASKAGETALRVTNAQDSRRLTVLNRFLITLIHQGRFLAPASAPFVQEAAELAERSGDLQQRFSFESNRALAHMDAGLLDEASLGFEKAAELLGRADMTFARANLACNRGTLNLAMGDINQAEACFRLAAEFEGTNVPKYASDAVHAGLGLCALEQGSMSDALKRHSLLGVPPSIWYYDPSLTMAFRSRLLERRQELDRAVGLLSEVASAVEGRLVAAWVKLRIRQLELLIRVQDQRTSPIAEETLHVAMRCGLSERASTLRQLLAHQA